MIFFFVTEKIEKRGIAGLSMLVDNLGGWPLTMSKKKWEDKKKITGKSWQPIDTQMHRIMGDSALFSIRVIVDNFNTSSYILAVNFK